MIITISVELSSDGTYVTLRDLTTEAEYNAAGINLTTDIVAVRYILTDPDSVDYTVDVTSDFLTSVRDAAGFQITVDDLSYGAEFFADGKYTSTLEVDEDSTGPTVTQTGTSDDIFYSQVLQYVITQIKNSDWKTLYNPYAATLSSDIRKRLMILDINYATQAGLIDEAERIRLALNKMCSYVG